MTDRSPNEGLWAFSLRTYGGSGVPAACLSLQDEHEVDVNVLLYVCWVGRVEGRLDEAALRRALDGSAEWAGSVVRPLRGARRWMKEAGCAAPAMDTQSCLALRERIKRVELEAEKLQQHMLESLARTATGPAGPAPAADNIRDYFRTIGVPWDPATTGRVAVILRSAFPGAAPADLGLVAPD